MDLQNIFTGRDFESIEIPAGWSGMVFIDNFSIEKFLHVVRELGIKDFEIYNVNPVDFSEKSDNIDKYEFNEEPIICKFDNETLLFCHPIDEFYILLYNRDIQSKIVDRFKRFYDPSAVRRHVLVIKNLYGNNSLANRFEYFLDTV